MNIRQVSLVQIVSLVTNRKPKRVKLVFKQILLSEWIKSASVDISGHKMEILLMNYWKLSNMVSNT